MTFDVLFEKPGKRAGQIVGRSPYLQPVHVMAPVTLIGRVVPATITEVGSNSLFGTLSACGADASSGPDHCSCGGLIRCERSAPTTASCPTPRPAPQRRSWLLSTTTGSPRCCSANTAKTSP